MMRDNHFADVRKLLTRKFVDGGQEIELTVTEFLDKRMVSIWVANRYGDSASVDFKADSAALREFVAAINEIISK